MNSASGWQNAVGRRPRTRAEKPARHKPSRRDLVSGLAPADSHRLQRLGLLAGLADLYIMGYGVGVWRELKRATGGSHRSRKPSERTAGSAGADWGVWRHQREAIEWAEQVRRVAA